MISYGDDNTSVMTTQEDGWLPFSGASSCTGGPGSLVGVPHTARPVPGGHRFPNTCLSLGKVTFSLIGFKIGPFSSKQGPVVQTF